VVFLHSQEMDYERRPAYADWVALEVVPWVDREYTTDPSPGRRASLGMGFEGAFALAAALENRGVFGRVATQSMFLMTEDEAYLEPLVASAAEQPLAVFLERARWDFRADHEGWNTATTNLKLAALLRQRGYEPVESEALDGFGWGAWRNRFDRVLEWTFPLAR
jgi:enterochelin esterase-like enzyme